MPTEGEERGDQCPAKAGRLVILQAETESSPSELDGLRAAQITVLTAILEWICGQGRISRRE